MVRVLRMTDLDLKGKRVLIREDLNVPVKNGVVTSDARIRASLPTMKAAHAAGARVMLMSHLGRPEEGVPAEEFSLAPIARSRWRSSTMTAVRPGSLASISSRFPAAARSLRFSSTSSRRGWTVSVM